MVNCRNLSQQIPLPPDPVERHRTLRLLRKLQNLIKFQSGKPELWIEAAEQVRAWLDDDQSVNFSEEATPNLANQDLMKVKKKSSQKMVKIIRDLVMIEMADHMTLMKIETMVVALATDVASRGCAAAW
jgi:superfamily I DNA and/or RNA helicase